MIRLIFKIIKGIFLTIFTLVVLVLLNHFLIGIIGEVSIKNQPWDSSKGRNILVLGAGSSEPGLWVNHSFDNRMQAVKRLINEGVEGDIVMSGMYKPPYYDEPDDMKRVLTQMGISENRLIADYEGVRTWSSIESYSMKFEDTPVTIVAQRAQLQRALFISHFVGAPAIGFKAQEPPYKHWYWLLREILARGKCSMDCLAYLIKKL